MVKHLDATFVYRYNIKCYYRNKFDREAVLENKEAEKRLMNCLTNPEFVEYAKYDQTNDRITVKSENFKVTIDPVSKFLDVPGFKKFYYDLLLRQGIIRKSKKKFGKLKLQPGTIIKGTAIALLLAAVLTAFVSRTEMLNIDGTSNTPTEIVQQIKAEEPLSFATLELEQEDDEIKPQTLDIKYAQVETTMTEKAEVPTQVEYIEETVITREEDLSNSEKVNDIKENYMNEINEICELYGLNPNLMLAIASQESYGYHSTDTSNAAIGLFQMEKGVWVGHTVNYINPYTGQTETITIQTSDLQDLKKNISLAFRYFKDECLVNANDNIFVAIQYYNYGYGNLNRVLDEYARIKGCTREDVINNQDDLGWMDYLYIIEEGDLDYIPHMMRYIDLEQFKIDFGITNEQLEQIDGIDVEIVKRAK